MDSASQTPAAEATRQQLLDAAEALFIEHGSISAVSVRAIVRAAGQRNQSALQYHFGNRDGLVDALAARRWAQIEHKRDSLCRGLPGDARPTLRDACSLLMRAPFQLCRDDPGFRAFFGLFGQVLLASEQPLAGIEPRGASTAMLRAAVRAELNEVPDELLTLRLENTNGMGLLAIVRRVRRGGSFHGRNAELFLDNLIDQIVALLSAPVSPATGRHLGPASD